MKSYYDKQYKCLLDMDGVIVNWLDGICEYEDIENPYDNDINWGINRFCNSYGCKMTVTRIYEIMDDYKFWAELKPLPFYKSIIDTAYKLFGEDNVCIVTKPTRSSNSFHGKYSWIQQYIPEFEKRCIFAMDKSFCANKNHILIDDMIVNYSKFIGSGGMAYLFPTLQNRRFKAYNKHLKDKVDVSKWFENEIKRTIRNYELESY
jgi:5'(3')-deoxyribonucleotidase